VKRASIRYEDGPNLGLALHKGVQEVAEGEVSQRIAVVDNGCSGQELPGHGSYAGMHMRCQRDQLPPGHLVSSRMQWFPAAGGYVTA